MITSLKNILVTGAEGALGSAVVKRFVASGTSVIGTYREAPGIADERITWVKMNISDSRSVAEGIASLRAQFGEIEGLIHCAGGFRYSPLEQTSDQDLDFLLNVNLRSAFLLLRELLPSMKKKGFGRIVLVSAKASLNPGAGLSAYAASKAGLNAIVSSVADEVRSYDININAVMPSMIDTLANRKDMPKADFAAWVKPEELAEIIFSLTQALGKPLNGALIPVTGRL